jgi:hypothetical protein
VHAGVIDEAPTHPAGRVGLALDVVEPGARVDRRVGCGVVVGHQVQQPGVEDGEQYRGVVVAEVRVDLPVRLLDHTPFGEQVDGRDDRPALRAVTGDRHLGLGGGGLAGLDELTDRHLVG